jgi:hypothetical protein
LRLAMTAAFLHLSALERRSLAELVSDNSIGDEIEACRRPVAAARWPLPYHLYIDPV